MILLILYSLYCIVPTYLYKLIQRKNFFRNSKNIFLTFDDGPDATYTSELLDLLKDHNIKATFFVVAKNAEKNEKIIKRMIEEGHKIALHSLEHKSALTKGIGYTKRDLCNSLEIMNNLNIQVSYYRPPWGHLNLATLYLIKRNNLQLVLWNVMADDWKKSNTSTDIKNKLISQTKSGDIICLHDSRGSKGAPKRTILALKEALPLLKQDYKFELLDKIYE